MTLDQITRMADMFFEWDSDKRETVTYTSALLFARHCVNNAGYLSQLHVLCADLGVQPGEISDRLFSAIEKVRDLKAIEKAAQCVMNTRVADDAEMLLLQDCLYGVTE